MRCGAVWFAWGGAYGVVWGWRMGWCGVVRMVWCGVAHGVVWGGVGYGKVAPPPCRIGARGIRPGTNSPTQRPSYDAGSAGGGNQPGGRRRAHCRGVVHVVAIAAGCCCCCECGCVQLIILRYIGFVVVFFRVFFARHRAPPPPPCGALIILQGNPRYDCDGAGTHRLRFRIETQTGFATLYPQCIDNNDTIDVLSMRCGG